MAATETVDAPTSTVDPTVIAPPEAHALAVVDHPAPAAMVRGVYLDREKIELLKRTICQGATDDELDLFVQVCQRTGLDPFHRQVFAVKRYDSKQRRDVMAIQVSIDGFRLIAERHGDYAGQRGPYWTADGEKWVDVWLDDQPPKAAKVGVLRHSFAEPLWAVARWDSFVQTYRDNGTEKVGAMWARMGDLMLGKCAEAQALRRAFPADLSGLYTPEEMAQAGNGARGWFGWESEDDAREAHAEIVERINASSAAEQIKDAAKTWRIERNLGWPMSSGSFHEFVEFVTPLLSDAAAGTFGHGEPATAVQEPTTTPEADGGADPAATGGGAADGATAADAAPRADRAARVAAEAGLDAATVAREQHRAEVGRQADAAIGEMSDDDVMEQLRTFDLPVTGTPRAKAKRLFDAVLAAEMDAYDAAAGHEPSGEEFEVDDDTQPIDGEHADPPREDGSLPLG